MKNYLIAFVLSVFLVGCGGGGSDSGGGGDYTGTYSGTIFLKATGPGGNAETSAPMVIVIQSDGQVLAGIGVADQSDGTSCQSSNGQPTVMQGNSFSNSGDFVCTVPGVGVCPTTASLNGKVNGNSLTGAGTFVYNCPPGTLVVEITFDTTKTSGPSRSPINDIAESISEWGLN